jgi:hypothetical protein
MWRQASSLSHSSTHIASLRRILLPDRLVFCQPLEIGSVKLWLGGPPPRITAETAVPQKCVTPRSNLERFAEQTATIFATTELPMDLVGVRAFRGLPPSG